MYRLLTLKAATLLIGICWLSASSASAQELRAAIQSGDLSRIEKAVKADPEILKSETDSMVIMALQNGQKPAAKKLLELGANPNAKDRVGRTILHWAIMRRDDDFVQALLDKNVNLETKDNNGYKPLMLSLYYNHTSGAKKLIDAGCRIDVTDNQKMTPLHIAFNNGNIEVGKLLIEKGCDLFAKNRTDVTPYMLACRSGQLEIVKDYFDEEQSLAKSTSGESCLLYAAYSGNDKVVEFLCQRTNLENVADKNGQTPLTSAVNSNNLAMAKVLLKHQADPNPKASQAYIASPILAAASYANPELTKVLLDAGANVDSVQTQTENQPLHLACQSVAQSFGMIPENRIEQCKKTIQVLLDAGADPNAKNQAKQTPLQIAVHANVPAAIDLLIRRTKDINIDLGAQSFLHWACENEMPNTVAVLLERDSSKANTSSDNGQTPLCVAALNGNVKIMKALLAAGADANLLGDDGTAPIHAAIALKPQSPRTDLGQIGPGARRAPPTGAQSANPSKESKSPEVIQILVDAGCDLTQPDSSGRMPLHIAAWHGNTSAIKLIASKSVNMTPETQAGSTPLHLATWQGHEEATSLLLSLGAPIDRPDADGWTALHKAAHRGNLKMVQLLLAKGADKTATDSLGLSAFQKVGGNQKAKIEAMLKF